jgi:hypothetical protein
MLLMNILFSCHFLYFFTFSLFLTCTVWYALFVRTMYLNCVQNRQRLACGYFLSFLLRLLFTYSYDVKTYQILVSSLQLYLLFLMFIYYCLLLLPNESQFFFLETLRSKL